MMDWPSRLRRSCTRHEASYVSNRKPRPCSPASALARRWPCSASSPGTIPARAMAPEEGRREVHTRSAEARKAVERGLAFLEADAAKWRKERKCATCHHGTMTVWALSEAKSQGYAVAAETLSGRDEVDQGATREHRQAAGHAARVEHGEYAGRLPGADGPGRARHRTPSPPTSSSGSPAISCGTRRPTGPGPGRWHRPRTGRRRSSSRTRS